MIIGCYLFFYVFINFTFQLLDELRRVLQPQNLDFVTECASRMNELWDTLLMWGVSQNAVQVSTMTPGNLKSATRGVKMSWWTVHSYKLQKTIALALQREWSFSNPMVTN